MKYEHKQLEYEHIKSGRVYVTSGIYSIKLFGKWLCFISYYNPESGMTFIRTKKNFLKKFNLLMVI